MRVSDELEERMRGYIKRNNITLNALVTAYFIYLLDVEEAQKNALAFDAEQV